MQSSVRKLLVGARSSPLSLAQIVEVQNELHQHHPDIDLERVLFTTVGDRDQTTSLRTLDKTDFFTRDIDEALLQGRCRLAVHSAKDLPYPLPEGIELAAITKGVDSTDSLVLRQNETIDSLSANAKIATSSERREEAVRQLRNDLAFIDVRGTIHQRLALLETGIADGVVVAEAALIRLGLTHLNRVRLPGLTTPLQGQLAIAVRTGDVEMLELFACLDTRPVHLHVGLTPPTEQPHEAITKHFPLIGTRRIEVETPDLSRYTHVIFTSKTAVHLCKDIIGLLKSKTIIAVGNATSLTLASYNIETLIAPEATAEGICQLLAGMDLEQCVLLWPRSAQARPVIGDYLNARAIEWTDWVIYETFSLRPGKLFPLDRVKKVFFSSPSCIDSFVENYGCLPEGIEAVCIGPVTERQCRETIG